MVSAPSYQQRPTEEPRPYHSYPPVMRCPPTPNWGVVREGQIGSQHLHSHWAVMRHSFHPLLGWCQRWPHKGDNPLCCSVHGGQVGRSKDILVSSSQDNMSRGLVGSQNSHPCPTIMRSPHCLSSQWKLRGEPGLLHL